jgi:uncharacterized membrane protein YhaH (DUF805 family)
MHVMSEPVAPMDGAAEAVKQGAAEEAQQGATPQPFAARLLGEHDNVRTVRVLSLSERIGRVRYLVYSLVAAAGCSVALFAIIKAAGYLPYSVALLLYHVAYICTTSVAMPVVLCVLAIRRLHDMDAKGWWVLLGLAPVLLVKWIPFAVVASPALALFLFCYPGSKEANRFGPPPPRNGQVLVATSVILPAILMLFYFRSEQLRRAAADHAQQAAPGSAQGPAQGSAQGPGELRRYNPLAVPNMPAKPPAPPLKRFDQPR